MASIVHKMRHSVGISYEIITKQT